MNIICWYSAALRNSRGVQRAVCATLNVSRELRCSGDWFSRFSTHGHCALWVGWWHHGSCSCVFLPLLSAGLSLLLLLSSLSFPCSFSLCIFAFERWFLGPAPGLPCFADKFSRHIASPSVFLSEILTHHFNHNLVFSGVQTLDISTLWKVLEMEQWKDTKRTPTILQDTLGTRH